MKITPQRNDDVLELQMDGRMDSAGARELQTWLDINLPPAALAVIWDMRAVGYLSSAGLRVLLALQKKLSARNGGVALAGLNPYCREIIATAGFDQVAPQFDAPDGARRHAQRLARSAAALRDWDLLDTTRTEHAFYRFIPGGDTPGAVNILGDVKDVLHATATEDRLASKRFFATEYSLGLGGLGDQPGDYFNIMGEMMTIGGTMVWLPTDGHDTADFLIPKHDNRRIMIRTTFNVALTGGFNELAVCQSAQPEGMMVGDLYQDLFELARRRRNDFKGVIGLAARLQMAQVYGSGVRKSPVRGQAPADGKMITHPSHVAEWFDCDTKPRHRDVTVLLVGLGADLNSDLSDYDETLLNRVFYLHPANISGKTALLHNHAVVFPRQSMPEQPVDLEREIQTVIDQGEFTDMRHLLDTSTITSGIIGISYIRDLRQETPDAAPELAEEAATPITPPPPEIRQKMELYRRMQGQSQPN